MSVKDLLQNADGLQLLLQNRRDKPCILTHSVTVNRLMVTETLLDNTLSWEFMMLDCYSLETFSVFVGLNPFCTIAVLIPTIAELWDLWVRMRWSREKWNRPGETADRAQQYADMGTTHFLFDSTQSQKVLIRLNS